MSRAAPATSADVAALVDGRLEGPGDLPVTGVNSLDEARDGEVSFAKDSRHAERIASSRARVILLSEGVDAGAAGAGRALVRVADAERSLIPLLEAFARARGPGGPAPGVHPSAHVDASARLGEGVRIGPLASIGAGCEVGAGSAVHAGARIGADVRIGASCEIRENAVVHDRVSLGSRVILRAGAVVGSEGFGFRPSPDGRGIRRVPHLGTVRIDDDVEIGAGTCIDRAKFGETVIGAGTKIDNLCQIGHNVRIGRSCVIAGLTGIAGSAVIGDGVRIGGRSSIGDHRRVGSGVTLAATSSVMNDVPDGATWAGTPAQDARTELRAVAAVRRLPELSRRLRQLLEGKPP
ncbi:MAG: UDP-3-O-(3-hydroxymyristoyl)glucosamine N-acyltransferase [Phycisphaerae bacterium]|nr:UDP-3-O-(3-hydroxymyristoyl)glucosamine N-acyltransferase [Phycisphaerae bacterium]